MSILLLLEEYKNNFDKRTSDFIKECLSYGMSESDIKGFTTQKIAKGGLVEKIPTLNPCVSQAASPQLKERFLFAGSWKEMNEHFLDIKQMTSLINRKKFQKWLKSMRENWGNSAPWLYPDHQLSVISVASEDDGDYTLLVWKNKGQEPEVWRYTRLCRHLTEKEYDTHKRMELCNVMHLEMISGNI